MRPRRNHQSAPKMRIGNSHDRSVVRNVFGRTAVTCTPRRRVVRPDPSGRSSPARRPSTSWLRFPSTRSTSQRSGRPSPRAGQAARGTRSRTRLGERSRHSVSRRAPETARARRSERRGTTAATSDLLCQGPVGDPACQTDRRSPSAVSPAPSIAGSLAPVAEAKGPRAGGRSTNGGSPGSRGDSESFPRPAMPSVSRPLPANLAERQPVPSIKRADRRPPDVSQDEPSDAGSPRPLGDVESRSVAADATGETDRPVPPRGVGEHHVGPLHPTREAKNSGAHTARRAGVSMR